MLIKNNIVKWIKKKDFISNNLQKKKMPKLNNVKLNKIVLKIILKFQLSIIMRLIELRTFLLFLF